MKQTKPPTETNPPAAASHDSLRHALLDHATRMAALLAADTALDERRNQICLDGVNEAREIGRQVELFTDREKLSRPGFDRLAPALQLALPDVSLEFAKRCLALHQRYPEPVTDAKLALEEWGTLRQLMLNLASAGHGEQRAHPVEPVKVLLAQIILVNRRWQALDTTHPIEGWDLFFLKTFLTETEPIAELHARALKAYGKGGSE